MFSVCEILSLPLISTQTSILSSVNLKLDFGKVLTVSPDVVHEPFPKSHLKVSPKSSSVCWATGCHVTFRVESASCWRTVFNCESQPDRCLWKVSTWVFRRRHEEHKVGFSSTWSADLREASHSATTTCGAVRIQKPKSRPFDKNITLHSRNVWPRLNVLELLTFFLGLSASRTRQVRLTGVRAPCVGTGPGKEHTVPVRANRVSGTHLRWRGRRAPSVRVHTKRSHAPRRLRRSVVFFASSRHQQTNGGRCLWHPCRGTAASDPAQRAGGWRLRLASWTN